MSCTFKLAIQIGDLFIPSLGTSHYLCIRGGGGGIFFSSTRCYFLGFAPPPPPPPKHTLTKKKTAEKYLSKKRLFCFAGWKYPALKDLKWCKNLCKVKKIRIAVQVFRWYFQPVIHIRLLTSLEQLANLGFGEWRLSISVQFHWHKNFMSTFVVGVGCLWYWWQKILHTDYPVNRLYWRKENQKSIVRDSKWLLFLCLYEAPYDKNKFNPPPVILYFNNDPPPIISKNKHDPPMIYPSAAPFS